MNKILKIPKDKEEWISLGIHQGETTKERCYEIIDILRRRKILCDITSCNSLISIIFFPIGFIFKKQYFVCIPNWVLWHKAREIIDDYDYKEDKKWEEEQSYISYNPS